MNPPNHTTSSEPQTAPSSEPDREMLEITTEEEKVLSRVQRAIEAGSNRRRTGGRDYDAELIALRDQIRTARLEDVPPLIEEMERLSRVAARRADVKSDIADPLSPYFGRLVLEEDDRKREVLIGRSTFLDSKTGVRIVDWRDAPVSRVYYRYEEGDDFDEVFGGREVEGEVLVRRSLSIGHAKLRRIGTPQGTFVKKLDGEWRRAGQSATRLQGGQGAAMRPENYHAPTERGTLGIRNDDEFEQDKSLGEITAHIDPAQFALISKPTSGLVVIQGGAGSGKTTIGLHRLAYLAFQDSRRFRPDKMLVLVFNDALVRYISRVLPSLGVEGVRVTSYERWASNLRKKHFPFLPKDYTDRTPSSAIRLKKHPIFLAHLDQVADEIAAAIDTEIVGSLKSVEGGGRALHEWRQTTDLAPEHRLRDLLSWLSDRERSEGLSVDARYRMERAVEKCIARVEDVVPIWGDLLTDEKKLRELFDGVEGLSGRELTWAHEWCARQIPLAIAERDMKRDAAIDRENGEDMGGEDALTGVDGIVEDDPAELDIEDDAILLRLHQKLRGPLMRGKSVLEYEHIFVDETQDVSPLELAVALGTASPERSVTLAGDVAQKLHMDNGFTNWQHVLAQLGLDHVSIEPLQVSYRSTAEILEFATEILGPLKNEVTGEATRRGAPVEFFGFAGTGEAVAFLSEALRDLVRAEPLASVAVIARTPEGAARYHKGLKHGEVPNLRLIANQDYPFRPGVDVTDIRQVKGLEFDYVVMVDVNASNYHFDDESRHLLHIGATRAAHQLWIVGTATPSPLIPDAMK